MVCADAFGSVSALVHITMECPSRTKIGELEAKKAQCPRASDKLMWVIQQWAAGREEALGPLLRWARGKRLRPGDDLALPWL